MPTNVPTSVPGRIAWPAHARAGSCRCRPQESVRLPSAHRGAPPLAAHPNGTTTTATATCTDRDAMQPRFPLVEADRRSRPGCRSNPVVTSSANVRRPRRAPCPAWPGSIPFSMLAAVAAHSRAPRFRHPSPVTRDVPGPAGPACAVLLSVFRLPSSPLVLLSCAEVFVVVAAAARRRQDLAGGQPAADCSHKPAGRTDTAPAGRSAGSRKRSPAPGLPRRTGPRPDCVQTAPSTPVGKKLTRPRPAACSPPRARPATRPPPPATWHRPTGTTCLERARSHG